MTNTYSVLNTIAAAGADITLVGRKLNVAITAATGSGQFPTMDYINIEEESTVAAAAEVLRAQDVSYTFANNTIYKFAITQVLNGINQTAFITYESDSNATDLEVATALVAQINAHTELGVSASGLASPITVTAVTGTPVFSIQGISNVTVAAASPVGTVAQGQGADLVAAGITGALAGSAYSQYVFTYGSNGGTQMGNATVNGGNIHTLYVDEGALNFADFNTAMGERLSAFIPLTTDADPAAVAVD